MSNTLNIYVVLSMPYQENTFIVWKKDAKDAIVIDPGLEPELILAVLQEKELNVTAILNTHGHADHIGGNETMKQAYPDAPLIIGENEKHLLTDANANVSALFGTPITSPPADQTVQEGDVVEFADISLEVLDIPGHSPGHVVFVYRDEPIRVFGGDVLFQGSIGRYDFPGSDGELLMNGIREKLFVLPDDTIVYPGHGPETTIGHEKKTNPFVGQGV